MIVQCATFSKSLNPRNIDKSVLDFRIRIQFPFESSFWISVSSCKLIILPDIQPANQIVIISAVEVAGVTFSDSDSTPVSKFLNPGPDPCPAIFFKFENPTPVQTPATVIDPSVIYPCFYLRNDHTDSCYCRN